MLGTVPRVLGTPRLGADDRGMYKSRRARLANRLRVARTERNLLQENLARAVGVSRNTVSSIETGRYTPSALLAFQLSEALGVPLTDLFWIEGGEQ
jgi:putative transcriptional regulator